MESDKKCNEHPDKVLNFNNVYNGPYTCNDCLGLFDRQEEIKHEKHSQKEKLCTVCYANEWTKHCYHYGQTFDMYGDDDHSTHYRDCQFCRKSAHKSFDCLVPSCEYCYDGYLAHFSPTDKKAAIAIRKQVLHEHKSMWVSDRMRENMAMEMQRMFNEKGIYRQCDDKINNCYICHALFHLHNEAKNCDLCIAHHKDFEIMRKLYEEMAQERQDTRIANDPNYNPNHNPNYNPNHNPNLDQNYNPNYN